MGIHLISPLIWVIVIGMVKSSTHPEVLDKKLKELEEDGWRVVRLKGKSPDAVASKDGKIIAVVVLASQWKDGTGWTQKWTYKTKRRNYEMFDDVLIERFLRIPKEIESDICDYNHCKETDTITEIIHGVPLTLCAFHVKQFKAEPLQSKVEHVYWAIDHLKRSAAKKWYRRRLVLTLKK